MLSVQVLMFLGIKKYIKIVQRRDSYVVIFNLIITLLSEGKYLSLFQRVNIKIKSFCLHCLHNSAIPLVIHYMDKYNVAEKKNCISQREGRPCFLQFVLMTKYGQRPKRPYGRLYREPILYGTSKVLKNWQDRAIDDLARKMCHK